MKAIKYYATEIINTWPKTGYLFENGVFLCEFRFHNIPHYICRKYDYSNAPEQTTWGIGVIDHNSISKTPGAIFDYQVFNKKEELDKDFETMKNSLLLRNVIFWSEENHPSFPLNNE